MSPVEGVHIVAVWRDGEDSEVVADIGDAASACYCHSCRRDQMPTMSARGLYRVTWRGESDPPEVERVGDLPDVDALAVLS